MIVEEFDDKQQIHQYISHLLDNEKEQLLKTGYFDKQLQNNTASFIHKNYVKYNQEQYNVINYLFKDNPKYKQMPIRQKCVLETIVNEVNKISEPKYNNDNNKILAIIHLVVNSLIKNALIFYFYCRRNLVEKIFF